MRRLTLLVAAVMLTGVALLAAGASLRAATVSVQRVAFIDTLAYSDGDLWVVRTDGSHQRLLVRGAEDPAWSPDGRKIAYSSTAKGGIWVVRADGSGARRLTTTLRYYNDQSRYPCCGTDSHPSWSPDGRRIVFLREWETADFPYSKLFIVDVHTRHLSRLTRDQYASESSPDWSPDGRRIAFTVGMGPDDGILTFDLATGDWGRLTHPSFSPFDARVGYDHSTPDWSPNGKKVAYSTDRLSQGYAIAVVNSNGTGARLIVTSRGEVSTPAWSPDGSHIAYHVSGSGEGANRQPGWLMIARSDGTRSFRLVRDGGEPDWKPRTSN
jgi:TolB protein